MPKITFQSEEMNLNETIEVKAGTTILDVAIEYDLPLEHVCGGCCACTTCRVIVKSGAENISKIDEDEKELVGSIDGIPGLLRLGCQSKIMGDVTVEIPS